MITSTNLHKILARERTGSEYNVALRAKIIEQAAIDFAIAIMNNVPECTDRSEAIRAVRAAKMWALTAVALDGEI